MKKQIKVTGIKKATGEYRRWLEQDWRRNADIVMCIHTGAVWCDVYIDKDTFNIYNDNVVSLIELFYAEYCGINDKKILLINNYKL